MIMNPPRLLLLLLACSFTYALANSVSFDKDLDDNCVDKLKKCQKDAKIWNTCPIACASHLQPEEGEMDFVSREDDDGFFDIVAKDVRGKDVAFDNFDGYVTLLLTAPKVMVPYYYQVLEHIQSLYPYVLEIVMVPLGKKSTSAIKVPANDKVVVLQEAKQFMEYLKGIDHEPSEDYVTAYILSVDGDFFQVLSSPTMEKIKENVVTDMKDLDRKKTEF